MKRRGQVFRGGAAAAVAWIAAAVALLWAGGAAGEEHRGRKAVRVSYQEFNRQMVVDENNRPVGGYAFDYIQTIATYAGWDLEWVPCASFADSLEQLRGGKSDLIYEISYTEERAKEMLFPDEPMGHEYYYLYSSAADTSIVPDDLSSLEGKTVGVTKGTTLGNLLREWCAKKDVVFKIVEYESIPEKETDLLAGKIDLDLELSMLAKPNLSAVEKVGSSAYYLVARKGRPDLADDINFAMDKVLNNDLYFFSRLQERYFSDTVLSRNLTTEEKKWLEGHRVLRAGYFDDYLPFSAKGENGEAEGSVVDAIRAFVRKLGLEGRLAVEFVCFDSQEEGYRAVERGDIDLMFPAYVSPSVQQDYRIIGGKGFATLASELAFLDEYGEGKDKRIGVNRNNLMQQYYSRDSFPDSEIVFYGDIGECLDGLLEGTSDGTFLNGARAEALLKPGKYHPLRTVRAKDDFQLRMAFARDDVGLMLLADRGLALLEPDFISMASYGYEGRMYKMTALDFLQEHILASIAAFAALAALLAFLAISRLSNRKLEGANQALVEYSEAIEQQGLREADLRRRIEKQQRELEVALHMAQAANRAKTTFLNNMSHDIRTPMNAIIGFTGLAASHLDEPEHAREYLATIAQSSEHLLALINDVLDMSRIESGKVQLHEKAESLPEILRALRDIVQADVQAKRHAFSIDTADVRDGRVWCDRTHLNQVLFNLVSNAIKYTPEGGTISLRVAQLGAAEGGRATFEFRCKDNGIGMEEGFLRTIFDPFTREESATAECVQGTGLGMAIAKNIVEMMGGRIEVESKKGEGTEFVVTVEFRVAEGAAEDGGTAEKKERPFPLKGKRVLMVDDSALNLKVGVLLLQEQGVEVDTAQNGREAVEKIRGKGAEAYDFVVMDVQMPVMGGYEATAEIRKLPGGDKVKIIAFSANAFEEDKEKSLQAGMDGHIAKPLKISEFVKELQRFSA